jgi:signal transduction histidine kinase
MVPPAENTGVPAVRAKKAEAGPSQEALEQNLAPETDPKKLAAEYAKLRERYARTTNALASAAHDLKTPLAIMNGYVELLRGEKLGPLNDRQREVLSDMHSSGHRLEHFIQDFLTFSVLETGEIKLHYETGDLNLCLSEICRMWSLRFQEKGLALYFLANEKLKEFSFDYAKVQRIVSNLLENASKYTPSGGTVWLHAEPHMWERRSVAKASGVERRRLPLSVPNAVKLSVSDTGPGIPAEFQMEIFDDFFRLPRSENQADGMGLGLAIARRLVNSMNGKIWVESDAGAGAKFSFLLPMKSISTGGKGPK